MVLALLQGRIRKGIVGLWSLMHEIDFRHCSIIRFRFEVKKWNAVALWAWDIVVDNCAICRLVFKYKVLGGTNHTWEK